MTTPACSTAPNETAHTPTTSAAIAIGDVVMLKSGGPRMTVVRVMPDGRLRCEWFSSVGSLGAMEHDFYPATLVPDVAVTP